MRALLLLMIVVGTLPMAFVKPMVGLILWIGFSYMNPHRIAYGFATGAPWVMITAVITLISIAMNHRERQPIPFAPITVLMLLFLAWTAICTLTAVETEMAQARWVEFFKIQVMAFATLMLVIDRQRLHWIIWSIVLSFGFWGFKGGLFTLTSGGNYHVLGPIKSFFRDNNGFALVMCMTLPLIRYLQLRESRRWMRYGLLLLMGLTAVSIIGTYSRGGFLALAVVGFVLLLKSRRRMGLLVVASIFVVTMVNFLPQKYFGRIDTISNYEEDSSAVGRLHSWEFATRVALARPLTGGGFNVWANDQMWDRYGPPGATHRAIHSIFFEVLGEQGFVGLGLFLAMIVVGWRTLARIRKQARAGPEMAWMGDLASMLQVSVVGFVAAGSLLPMPYFDLFYQLLAMTVLLQVQARKALSKRGSSQEEDMSAILADTDRLTTDRTARAHVRSAMPRGVVAPELRDLPRW